MLYLEVSFMLFMLSGQTKLKKRPLLCRIHIVRIHTDLPNPNQVTICYMYGRAGNYYTRHSILSSHSLRSAESREHLSYYSLENAWMCVYVIFTVSHWWSSAVLSNLGCKSSSSLICEWGCGYSCCIYRSAFERQ